jgi:hypothetical protein
MTRISLLLVVFVAVASSAACNKPSDAACRKAISNMRSLLGTDSATSTADIEGDIRRCKGGSRKKAVECAGNAKTIDELRACEFMKVPASKTGSANGSATGSAPAGSAAGSATGSAAGSSDMGSASAGSGSAAAAGSAVGSGAGSATDPAAAGSAAK